MSIQSKIDSLKKFNRMASRYVVNEIKKQEPLIIDMNVEEQLYEHGITNDNVPIMNYQPYRPATISIKKQKGQPTNRVTLRDSGDWGGAFYLKKKGHGFELDSKDWKNGDLADKYGEEIYGLTDDNMNELRDFYIKPRLQQELTKAI